MSVTHGLSIAYLTLWIRALAVLVVELFVQVLKRLSNRSSDRKMSVVRVRKEVASCKCPQITIVLLSVLQVWKKCQNECSI